MDGIPKLVALFIENGPIPGGAVLTLLVEFGILVLYRPLEASKCMTYKLSGYLDWSAEVLGHPCRTVFGIMYDANMAPVLHYLALLPLAIVTIVWFAVKK